MIQVYYEALRAEGYNAQAAYETAKLRYTFDLAVDADLAVIARTPDEVRALWRPDPATPWIVADTAPPSPDWDDNDNLRRACLDALAEHWRIVSSGY